MHVGLFDRYPNETDINYYNVKTKVIESEFDGAGATGDMCYSKCPIRCDLNLFEVSLSTALIDNYDHSNNNGYGTVALLYYVCSHGVMIIEECEVIL